VLGNQAGIRAKNVEPKQYWKVDENGHAQSGSYHARTARGLPVGDGLVIAAIEYGIDIKESGDELTMLVSQILQRPVRPNGNDGRKRA
jgi:hypothetical protein